MISKKIENALNNQIQLEGDASHYYLSMASWAEVNGFQGTSKFLYKHAEEERMHMLKLFGYINERGGRAIVPTLKAPPKSFKSMRALFDLILSHEVKVTQSINKIVEACLAEKDYTTHNFLQWYVSEQLEEEALARSIIDKLELIGDDKGGLYLFDRDLETMTAQPA
ncbi:MAG: ferritin [Flavobacteriaceae bacterium]|nr:ferritin [Flavobacteriaceae bacterium]